MMTNQPRHSDVEAEDLDSLLAADEASRTRWNQEHHPKAKAAVDFDPNRLNKPVLDTSEEARQRRLTRVEAESEDTL